MSGLLLPAENMALTVARAQAERGENPTQNISVVLVMTLDRLIAALGDDVLYKVCPDCNGNGSMDAPSMLGGLEQECLRCQAMGGLVQVYPEGDSDG